MKSEILLQMKANKTKIMSTIFCSYPREAQQDNIIIVLCLVLWVTLIMHWKEASRNSKPICSKTSYFLSSQALPVSSLVRLRFCQGYSQNPGLSIVHPLQILLLRRHSYSHWRGRKTEDEIGNSKKSNKIYSNQVFKELNMKIAFTMLLHMHCSILLNAYFTASMPDVLSSWAGKLGLTGASQPAPNVITVERKTHLTDLFAAFVCSL